MTNLIQWSITLGIKPEFRKKFDVYTLSDRVIKIFEELGFSYILYSIEEYKENRGLHVHMYYYGKPIYWIRFNQLWGIGYVKNKPIYDLDGWLNYITKTKLYWEYGRKPDTSKISRFLGKSLHETIMDMKNEKLTNLPLFVDDENEDIFF